MSISTISQATPTPGKALLTPDNSVFVFADHQPQMFFATGSDDRTSIINAAVGLGRAAKIFNVPVILTTVAADTFAGHLMPQLHAEFPDHPILDRTTMNPWEDSAVVEAIKATGRRKLVLSGLWTEVCVVLPALSALEQGFEVYVVADASGGFTPAAHQHAMERMIQAGAYPVTWIQVLLELQRDWARLQTYDQVGDLMRQRGGVYGQGLYYANDFVGVHAS
ncbi:hydrolase [Mycobacterium sp. UM_CSW]|uniref:hydrolase n=1 Tax=Mycobacterium sp. UM_CSW TaxID=1370119 RepID=UPI0003FDE065|nr:hydrolase [Mycobacterium sp. UM_CSW]